KGSVANEATATSGDVPSTPGTTEDPTEPAKSHLTVNKETTSEAKAEDGKYVLGETITYKITVVNDGNQTVTGITVEDEFTGDSWEIAKLAPGESKEFTASHVVTEADLVKGSVANEATATSGDVPSTPGTTEDPTEPANKALTVTKVASAVNGNTVTANTMVRPNDVITYTITVKNSGNQTLTNVAVTDTLLVKYNNADVTAGNAIATIASMAPDASETYTVTYTVTQADVDAENDIVNTAIATAQDGTTAKATTTTGIPVNPDVTVSVTKEWIDNNNQDGLRTDVTIQLMNGTTPVTGKTVTLTASKASDTFTGLPKYDENGTEIAYTVTETTQITDYTAEVTGSMANGFTVTNTHEPYKIKVSGTKSWKQDEVANRPESITVQLMNGTTVVDTTTATRAGGWTYEFTDLDRRANGTDIEYTIEEVGDIALYYAVEYSEPVKDANGNITINMSNTKVGHLNAAMTSDSPKADGTKAEPEDTVTFTLNLSDSGEGKMKYPTTIEIDLNGATRAPENVSINDKLTVDLSTLPAGATYNPSTGKITFEVTEADIANPIEIKVTVGTDVPAGSRIEPAIVKGATTTSDPIEVPIEQTVKIQKQTHKNIVLALDVSGSMNFCVEHGTNYLIDGYNRKYTGYISGADPKDIVACIDCGTEHVTYTNRRYSCSVEGHGTTYIDSRGSGFNKTYYCTECATNYPSRMKALKTAAKAFIDSILENKGNETITVTLVTFATDVNTGSTITLSATTVNTIKNSINNMSADGGTNIRGGISSAADVLKPLGEADKDATNILVFLSDGEPNDTDYYVSTDEGAPTITKLNSVNNIEKFAVGLGNSFSRTELEAIVGDKHKNDRIFSATDEDELVETFEDIADKINNMQTHIGYAGTKVTDKDKIYPVVLSYTDFNNVAQTPITCNNLADLTANNVTIADDGEISWDVSQYAGYDNFVITLGTGVATPSANGSSSLNNKSMLKKAMVKANVVNNEEITWKLTAKGKASVEDKFDSAIALEQNAEIENLVEDAESINTVTPVETSKSNILSSIIEQAKAGELEEKLKASEEGKTVEKSTEQEDTTSGEKVTVEDKQDEKAKVEETKPETKAEETKATETKPTETKPETKTEETKPEVKQEEKVEPVVEDKSDEKSEETGKNSVEPEVTEPSKVEEKVTVEEDTQVEKEVTEVQEPVQTSEPVIELTVDSAELVTVNTIAE
ncbi:MAG: Cna B-type domain-containing protein, partial [Clostridia bacterium]|nr:Cna B-type domain-containing protein [Clostridia bacterium]